MQKPQGQAALMCICDALLSELFVPESRFKQDSQTACVSIHAIITRFRDCVACTVNTGRLRAVWYQLWRSAYSPQTPLLRPLRTWLLLLSSCPSQVLLLLLLTLNDLLLLMLLMLVMMHVFTNVFLASPAPCIPSSVHASTFHPSI